MIQLQLVRTRQTKKYHILTQILLVGKQQTQNQEHYQPSHQNAKKNRKKGTYQRIWSQNHHRQTHHWTELILPMTENIAKQKSNDAIKRKITGNTRNSTRQTHNQETLIRPKKVIIK